MFVAEIPFPFLSCFDNETHGKKAEAPDDTEKITVINYAITYFFLESVTCYIYI